MRPSSSFELSSRADSLTYLRAHRSIATRSSTLQVCRATHEARELFGCRFNRHQTSEYQLHRQLHRKWDAGRQTEEPLKWRVLGTRARGVPAMGPFDHTNGAGFVAPHRGDYLDAIANRKAAVHLLVHEATLGGMSPYAARHLRRLSRAAVANGIDGTDYTRSFTARSFVPHFGQRISTACVMHGAEGILKGTIRKTRATTASAAHWRTREAPRRGARLRSRCA